MQLTMEIHADQLQWSGTPAAVVDEKEVKAKLDSEDLNEEDHPCLFCGGERTSNRKCCSTLCFQHLNDYSNSSIPSVLVRTLHSLSINERVKRLQELAERQNVSFQSLVKHFIKGSKKMGKNQGEIILTPLIAEFISLTGKIPDSIKKD
jgi:hypothetical protein